MAQLLYFRHQSDSREYIVIETENEKPEDYAVSEFNLAQVIELSDPEVLRRLDDLPTNRSLWPSS